MSVPRRKVAVTLTVTHVPACPDEPTQACCLECGEAVALHQPEPEAPRHLLGTCDACGRWFLLGWSPGDRGGVMVLLPEFEALGAEVVTALSFPDRDAPGCGTGTP